MKEVIEMLTAVNAKLNSMAAENMQLVLGAIVAPICACCMCRMADTGG